MNKILSVLILFLCIVNYSEASSVVGKISYNKGNAREILPLITDSVEVFDYKSYITLKGARIVANKDTSIKISETDEKLLINIYEGTVFFRIFPEKTRISFLTPHGEILMPKVVNISSSEIEGIVTVAKNSTTTLQLNQGSMDVLTPNGFVNLHDGEGIVLAQADIESKSPNSSSNQIGSYKINTKNTLPVEILSYIRLAGERGLSESVLNPDGTVSLKHIRDENYDAKVVNYSLREIDDSKIDEDKPVKVICSSIDGDDSKLFVRPTDRLYPELVLEKNLIGIEVDEITHLDPNGLTRFDIDDEEEIEKLNKYRSLENWHTVIVDEETLQPDGNEYSDDDENKRKDKQNQEDEDDDDDESNYRVICIRSTLILQPIEDVNPNHVELVGKKVIVKEALNPRGKVIVSGGKLMDGEIVDYNLQPIKGANIPPGRTMEVVGVKEGSTILLLQFPSLTQEEIPRSVGKTVTAQSDFDPFGIVELESEEWWGVVVDNKFNPVETSFPSGTKFKVVSSMTSLLVEQDPILIAAFFPQPTLSPLVPIIIGGTIITGTAVAIPFIIDDDGGGGSGGDGGDDGDDGGDDGDDGGDDGDDGGDDGDDGGDDGDDGGDDGDDGGPPVTNMSPNP